MHKKIWSYFLVILLPLSLAAAEEFRTDGYGQVRIGADYEAVKRVLVAEGRTMNYRIGMGDGEVGEHAKSFSANFDPEEHDGPDIGYTVIGSVKTGKIWHVTVSYGGAKYEPEKILPAFKRLFGNPTGNPAENNYLWVKPGSKVTLFVADSMASAQFIDTTPDE